MSADPDRLLQSATWLLVSFFGLLAGSALLMPVRALVGPWFFFTAIALAVVIASRLLGPVAAAFNGLLAGLFYNFFFDKPYDVLHLAHWSDAAPVLTSTGLGLVSWMLWKAWHLRRTLADQSGSLTVHVVSPPMPRANAHQPHPVSLQRIPRTTPRWADGPGGRHAQSPLRNPKAPDSGPGHPPVIGTSEAGGPWPM